MSVNSTEMADETPAVSPLETHPADQPHIPGMELAHAEVLHLQSAALPPGWTPEVLAKWLQLGFRVGPTLIEEWWTEDRRIEENDITTHIDMRLHYLQGRATRADFMAVRAIAMGANPKRRR